MANAFELDRFISDARAAARGPEPRAAMRRLMEEAVQDHAHVASVMPGFEGDDDGVVLFEDETISIWNARFRVGHEVPAHDHRMTATIGVYRGAECNQMWRSDGQGGIEKSGEVTVSEGEVYQIGPSAIHSVTCASETDCLGIHVYLGELTTVERSLFDVETGQAMPFTDENYARLTGAT